MGKRKSRTSGGSVNAENISEIHVPTFDQKTLSALTSRIEKELSKKNLPSNQGSIVEFPTSKSHNPDQNSETKNRRPKKKIRASREPDKTNLEKTTDSQNSGKGVGRVKHSLSGKAESDEDFSRVLLKEILELGGTQEDLELVENIVSDSEREYGKTSKSLPFTEKSLRKELASFAADLDIQNVAKKEESKVIPDAPACSETTKKSSSTSINATEKLKSTATIQALKDLESMDYDTPDHLIFEPRPDWYAIMLPSLPTHKVKTPETYNSAIKTLKEYSLRLLEAENKLYTSKNLSSSSSQRFLHTIMTSGTLSDKISALTLVIQESPTHSIKSFEGLLGLAKKRSRGQAVIALAAIKDLFGTGAVLPPDRRLRTFENQPGLLGTLSELSIYSWRPGERLPGGISKVHLFSWAFEDWLKQYYFEVLKILESWCGDEVEYARSRVVAFVFELLRDKPEQESNLLRLLVNKLGDTDKKISSKASYLILQLQTSHPLMKPIIIRSIESEILLRPGQSMHAKYYAITTLNQTILSVKEDELAKTLLRIYFELFVSLLKKNHTLQISETPATSISHKKGMEEIGTSSRKKTKAQATSKQKTKDTNGELDEKMISAVLTGINRAFPFSKSDDLTLESQMDTLFKITHSSNFNTSVQALILIEQLAITKNLSLDRFYKTLYESLLDPRLINSSKHSLYLNLLYRSLRADVEIVRVKSFVKRMIQIATLHQPPFVCGIIYLIKELELKFPGIRFLLTEPEENEIDEEKFYDVIDVIDDVDTVKLHEPTQLLACSNKYDGKKRDPRHNNVNKSCLWELAPFTAHFHPSVSLFAICLLENAKMPPKPDLASHTLSSFLDRFVYRNAKTKSTQLKGTSIMQPLAGSDRKAIFLLNKSIISMQLPLNSESFWRKKTEEVAADEVFFHKYFNGIGKRKQSKRSSSRKTKICSSDDDDESENEIFKALVRSNPNIEDSESDIEVSGMDDSYSESSFGEQQTDDETEKEDLKSSLSDSEEEMNSPTDVDPEIRKLFEQELLTSNHEKPEEVTKTNKRKRNRIKDLPLFASVDDYAVILDKENGEEL